MPETQFQILKMIAWIYTVLNAKPDCFLTINGYTMMAIHNGEVESVFSPNNQILVRHWTGNRIFQFDMRSQQLAWQLKSIVATYDGFDGFVDKR